MWIASQRAPRALERHAAPCRSHTWFHRAAKAALFPRKPAVLNMREIPLARMQHQAVSHTYWLRCLASTLSVPHAILGLPCLRSFRRRFGPQCTSCHRPWAGLRQHHILHVACGSFMDPIYQVHLCRHDLRRVPKQDEDPYEQFWRTCS